MTIIWHARRLTSIADAATPSFLVTGPLQAVVLRSRHQTEQEAEESTDPHLKPSAAGTEAKKCESQGHLQVLRYGAEYLHHMPAQTPTQFSDADFADIMRARHSTDPVPILIHKAENRVIRELRDLAVKGCDEHVRRLAECAEGKLLSVVWHCRVFSKAVDDCMRKFGDDEALKDELRRRHGKKFPRAVKGYRLPGSATAF